MEYPHTTIQADLASLSQTLRSFGHADLSEKVDSVLSQYRKKREWFLSLKDSDSEDSGSNYSKVSNLPGYPHTSITNDLDELSGQLEGYEDASGALSLVERIREHYGRKHEFLFRELGSRL